ncbi:amino acid transporter [Phellopilus nigrolimitatus]|nr:amino acid transporter [Phellopilus nigrolimitatus]
MDSAKPNIAQIEDGTASLSTDEAFLVSLGYKQEFKRCFSKVELFGVSFSIIGLVPSIASACVYAIPNGGPSAMVWGWATCVPFLACIGLAMGELGSAMPTSGGLYYWTFTFSSPRWRCLLSWIVGYANTIGLIAGLASVDYGLAIQVMAAASIGTDMAFTPTTAQTFGVYAALLITHSIICSIGTRFLARMQNVYVLLNILLILAIVVALPTATPKEFRNSANYALGNFTNLSGWTDGFAFILSFLTPLWTIGAFDSSLHISEEATNSQTAVPFAMIWSAVLAGFLGWGVNVALAFNMGTDLEGIVSNEIGQPLATIFFNSFGKTGTLVLWSFLVIVQFMMGSSTLLASSRQTFAFARDGGLPLSRFIYRMNSYTQTPVNGVWVAAFFALMLGLLAFAGESALSAIFTVAVIGLYVSYSIPIVARFVFKNSFKPGPFHLGRYSLPIATVAVSWMTFMSVVFLFPLEPSATANEMNYSVVVFMGVLFFSLTYYFFPVYGGIHWFKGPAGVLRQEELAEKAQNFESESIEDSAKVDEVVTGVKELERD